MAKQPSEQPVKYYVTGSAAIEDSVEAGTQDLGLLRAGRQLVFLQGTIEPPDHPLGDLDGVALLVVGGNQLVDEAFGVNPAQRMDADAKLAGVIGNDDGVRQQPLMADRAPQRVFAGDQDRIGGDVQVGQVQRLQMPLPVLGPRENTLLVIRELADGDLRELAVFHIVERRVVDHIKRSATAQPRQKRQARFARAGAKHREGIGADLCGVAALAGVARPGVVDRHIGAAKTGFQHRFVFGAERLQLGRQQAHDLPL